MRTARWLGAAVVLAAGCGRPPPPAEPAETLVVYSLDPWPLLAGDEPEPGRAVFHSHLVLGSVGVADPSRVREILDGVHSGIEAGKQVSREGRTMCRFQPRHGLRHVAKDGTETDWLICFQCRQIQEWRDGTVVKKDRLYSPEFTILTSIQDFAGGPRPVLDDTLRTAGVELAD